MIHAAADRTFYILANPAAADLYDQYEQRLSQNEKAKLPANMPFEIITAKQLMGDQISQGMRLSFFGATYYIMLDEKGNPAGLPPAAGATLLRQCSILDDSGTVALPGVVMAARYPSTGNRTALKKGESVERIFSYRHTTLIRRLGTSMSFGWITSESRWFTRQKTAPAQQTDTFEDLHHRILRHLAKINIRYDTLFAFFNRQTGQSRSVPHWEAVPSGKIYRYVLRGTPETVTQLAASTAYITGEIERILLGKPYSASCENGIITISPRVNQ